MMKQVQEIAADCDQLPERYIRKQDKEYGGNLANAHETAAVVPVVDFSLLTTSSASELDSRYSLGLLSGSFLDKVHEISKQFFKLPAKEKKKYLREESDVEGYGNDTVFSDHQTLDWTDRLCLTVLPQDQQRLHFWPQNPTHFREVLNEYSSKIKFISEVVLKSLARSLNLEEGSFMNQYGSTVSMNARFNYYPPCPWPEKVFGAKAHADSSAITVLLQDKEVEGLQLLKDDQWFRVPIVQDALTSNVGDQMDNDKEEILLAEAWIEHSQDNNIGKDQRDEIYWNKIIEDFHDRTTGPVRTKNMLTGKWTRMHGDCQRFNAYYKQANRKSRENEADLIETMKTVYLERVGKKFQYPHVWKILKEYPKWDAAEPIDGDNLQEVFGPDKRERPAGKQRAGKKQKSVETSGSTGGSQSESVSSLVSQDYRRKCDAAERAYEAQREKDLAIKKCEEMKFLMIDTSNLPPHKRVFIERQQSEIMRKYQDAGADDAGVDD
ncbi:SRG1-like protein [Tanacetum coccineum]